jgi:hypothetical protein
MDLPVNLRHLGARLQLEQHPDPALEVEAEFDLVLDRQDQVEA